jgi:hypothetical protein
MSRETIPDAIRRHAGRGMSRRQLVMTYGKDAVIRVLGNEEEAPKRSAAPAIVIEFGERLRLARLKAKHTLMHVASLVGAHASHISAYEEGATYPFSTERIQLLADYMGEPFSALNSEIAKAILARSRTRVRAAPVKAGVAA